jgi:mannose-1-phosphate guanylyltransferase
MRYAMIMAGGAGTRLWPMSRQGMPKQLARLFTGTAGQRDSLLGLAYHRLHGLIPAERRLICTSESYRAEITAQISGITNDQILGEPVGRDTVNAVGLTAAVLALRDPKAVFAVLTADHVIAPPDKFRTLLDAGFALVEEDPTRLVTFSVKPTYPATGFGYVERGPALTGSAGPAFRVERFVEKPSAERAQAYVESGAFGWNAGMFVWSASTFLDCLRRYKPDSHEGLMKIQRAWDTPDRAKVLAEVYPTLPKISVDYAIMEPASREQARTAGKASEPTSIKLCTVVMDLDWLDVGSWPSFGETLTPDNDGNRTSGRAVLHEGKGNLVVNDDSGHIVAVLGAEDLVVVHTREATLVMPKSKAQDLKTLHARLPDALK